MKSFLNLTFLSDFLLCEIIPKPISFSERVAKSSALFDLQTQAIRHRADWVFYIVFYFSAYDFGRQNICIT